MAAERDTNDLLDPRAIRDWTQRARRGELTARRSVDFEQHVRLIRQAASYLYPQMYVSPIEVNGAWTWIDKAGYAVAEGALSQELRDRTDQYEFTLDVLRGRVTGHPYLAYQQSQ
jgi:hypothetical protein